MERARFFTREQKKEHAAENGWQCEFEIERGVRCPENGYLEADHIEPFSKGGQTEAENMILVCVFHHWLKHLISDEPYSARLIYPRIKDHQR